jgi:predicted DNA-binding protein YlxM (UPF0122 family)
MATPVSKDSGRLSTITTPELNRILPESLTVGICERYYKCHGEMLPELMAMCLGLKTVIGGDRMLGDAMIEPYASMKFRKKVTPTQQHMVEEIKRRARCGDDPAPACKYWAKEKLMTWLKENPVTLLPDILFLRKEERKLYDTVVDGLNEAAEGPRASSWTTNDPYLRMYHCMFHEDVKASLADMSRVLDHDELDARNSSERPPDFFQAVANAFNDDTLFFISESLPELHYCFANPMSLYFEDMPGPLTAEECKKRFADCRAKLIKIISKWELSGNGFGQRALDEDDFGHLDEENFEAGDNRGNFLDSQTKEHILYFWHMADSNQLLKNVLNVIAETSSADTHKFQLTSENSSASGLTSAKRKTIEAKAVNDFRRSMGSAMQSMSHAAYITELRTTEDQANRYEEKILLTEDESLKKLYTKCLKREEKRIEEIQEAIDQTKRHRVSGSSESSDED